MAAQKNARSARLAVTETMTRDVQRDCRFGPDERPQIEAKGDRVREYYKGRIFLDWTLREYYISKTIVHEERDMRFFVF